MSTQLPTYDEITALLAAQDELSAAECHGVLCGMLSCQVATNDEEWARQVLTGALLGESGAAVTPNAVDVAALAVLYRETDKQMADVELGFQLLLPDDDSAINERLVALTQWCDGYLYGLSLGGIKDFAGFSEPVQEFCRDLIEISRLEHDESENEENESAFFEVSEYVRMGALMVRDELENRANNAPEGTTLH